MSDVRIYPMDQLTLPEEISSALQVKEGDYLEVSTVGGAVILKPTRIFPHGSPEAEEEYRRSKQAFAEGRYHTSESVESLAEHLGIPLGEVETSRAEVLPIGRLVEEALSATEGDTAAAVEYLEEAKRSLELKGKQSVVEAFERSSSR